MILRKQCVFLLAAILLPVNTIFAQKSISAFRLAEPITIDGIHEQGKWIGADSAIEFIQMEPFAGAAEIGRAHV